MQKGTRTTLCEHWKFAGRDLWAHRQCFLRWNGDNCHGCPPLHLETSVCQHASCTIIFSPPPLFLSESDAFALYRSLSFFLCDSFGVSLSHTHRHHTTHFEWGQVYWEVCYIVWYSWYLSIKKTVSFNFSKNTYLFKHTPSYTVLSISTINYMSNKRLVFEGQISSKKTPKSHADTFYDALWHFHYAQK